MTSGQADLFESHLVHLLSTVLPVLSGQGSTFLTTWLLSPGDTVDKLIHLVHFLSTVLPVLSGQGSSFLQLGVSAPATQWTS